MQKKIVESTMFLNDIHVHLEHHLNLILNESGFMVPRSNGYIDNYLLDTYLLA